MSGLFYSLCIFLFSSKLYLYVLRVVLIKFTFLCYVSINGYIKKLRSTDRLIPVAM